MTPAEIRKVEAYLRRTFGNDTITVSPPPGKGKGSCEVAINDEFIGTLNRDEDEGEVSYDFNMVILDLDL
ncbi:DUF3126 family protein [Pararhodospirillum oryzae]|uniref:DUF3126 domain-containing protein n=1 Tax=Pararhodospirillum oryzae TaxID=478448 RepID=A0A512H7Q3_9PROT|nr:DUF3126 family protein [Pararhodospirillum oryzae]GEO81482.1 hypothetical protein ROR02_16130 [Pararhodospirillum oryzae]